MRGKLGPLTPQQEEALEALTRGIINKIAHGPISELRAQAGEPEGVHVVADHPKGVPPTGMTLMLVIASRGSQLALWQARWVEARLGELGHECRIEIIKTTATRSPTCRWPEVGTKGLFTKEIEEALLDGRVDLAVHSLKDLPTELPEGLALAAMPEREDPRDASSGRRWRDLQRGAQGRHQFAAARGAIARAAAGSAGRIGARQPRHAAAQARRRASTTRSCWRPPG